MASSSSVCADCGKHVEILNGDFESSMQLHKQQSHKSCDLVIKDLDHPQGKINNTSRLKEFLDDCKEDIKIKINDVSLYFQLQGQKQKPDNANALFNNSSTPSGERTNHEQLLAHLESNSVVYAKKNFESVLRVQSTNPQNAQIDHSSSSRDTNVQSISEPMKNITLLEENIMGQINNKSTKKKNNKKSPSTSRRSSDTSKMDYSNTVYEELLENNPVIKLNAKYLERKRNLHIICKLCKKSLFAKNVRLEENIIEHITGEKHMRKLEHKHSTSRDSSERTKMDVALMELLEANATIKSNARYLERGKKILYVCKLCDRTPINGKFLYILEKNIVKHINREEHHKNLAKELSDMPAKSVPQEQLPSTSRRLSDTTEMDYFNTVYEELLENNPTVKLHAKYLEREGNVYTCKLCVQTPISVKNVSLLEESIMSHIIGEEHVQKEKKHCDNRKLSKTNTTIKSNTRYLEKKENHYICKLCDHPIYGRHRKHLERNIIRHVTWKIHTIKAEEQFYIMVNTAQLSNEVIQTNRKFLIRKYGLVFCTLCKCTIPLGDDDDVLIVNVSKHFEGPDHVKNMAMKSICSSS